jgi:hypothetical protein
MCGVNLRPDRLRIVVLDFLAGLRIETLGDVAEPHFEEVGELRHRADRGARRFYGVRLLNGNRRTDVLYRVDFRFVEQIEKLARVGAERFDVTPLSFGVKRVEDEGRFSGAAESGDDDVFPERDIEIEALEVVLPNAAQPDAFELGRSRHRIRRNHGPTK